MKYLKISEFSQITGLSRQTLIFYDREGLLKPVYTDPDNHYRYYSRQQIDWASAIVVLRESGVNLKKLKELNHSRTPAEMITIFQETTAQLTTQIKQLTQFRHLLEERKRLTDQGLQITSLPNYKIIYQEEQPIFSSRHSFDQQNYWIIFQEFVDECQQFGIAKGIPIRILKDPQVHKGSQNYFYHQLDNYDLANAVIPAGKYFVMDCHTNYQDYEKAFKQFSRALNRQLVQPNGPWYQEFLIDEVCSANPEQYVAQLKVKL